jgi:hypothetical protein
MDFPTDAQLAPIVAQAKKFCAAALGAKAAATLDHLQVVIGDLPNGKLGALTNGYIVIDGTAAGRGWFIDPTPQDSSEFTAQRGAGALAAARSSPAYGRVDPLTVVMHKIGHALSRDHEATGEMAESLQPGERESPLPATGVSPVRAHPPVAKPLKGGWLLSRFYRR